MLHSPESQFWAPGRHSGTSVMLLLRDLMSQSFGGRVTSFFKPESEPVAGQDVMLPGEKAETNVAAVPAPAPTPSVDAGLKVAGPNTLGRSFVFQEILPMFVAYLDALDTWVESSIPELQRFGQDETDF